MAVDEDGGGVVTAVTMTSVESEPSGPSSPDVTPVPRNVGCAPAGISAAFIFFESAFFDVAVVLCQVEGGIGTGLRGAVPL